MNKKCTNLPKAKSISSKMTTIAVFYLLNLVPVMYYSNVLPQLIYNLNSRWAYKDRIPIWETGKQKGPKGAKAYKEAKAEFKTKLKEKTGLSIGKMIICTSILCQ